MRIRITALESKEAEHQSCGRKHEEEDRHGEDHCGDSARNGERERFDDCAPQRHAAQDRPGHNRTHNAGDGAEDRRIPCVVRERSRRCTGDDLAKPRQYDAERSTSDGAADGQADL